MQADLDHGFIVYTECENLDQTRRRHKLADFLAVRMGEIISLQQLAFSVNTSKITVYSSTPDSLDA